MFCSKCGAELNDSQKFCHSCGAEVITRKCIRCGKPLPYGSQFCSNCGEIVPDNSPSHTPNWPYDVIRKDQEEKRKREAEEKKRKAKKRIRYILIMIIAIILLFFGCVMIAPMEDTAVPVTPTPAESKSSGTSLFKSSNGIGDTAKIDGIKITLLDVSTNTGDEFFSPTAGNEYVVCKFEIENTSSDNLSVSSFMSFLAYFDDYCAQTDIMAISSVSDAALDGTVSPGKKMIGVVGYEVTSGWKNLEIMFQPNPFLDDMVTFKYTK